MNSKFKTKIDLTQLRIEIQQLNPRKQLYKVLKDELGKWGWWKQRKRGKPNYNFGKRKTQ